MVFKLSRDDASVSCSSPHCVRGLLSQGWRLADPSQTAGLVEACEEIEDAEAARALPPTLLPRGPGTPGLGGP